MQFLAVIGLWISTLNCQATLTKMSCRFLDLAETNDRIRELRSLVGQLPVHNYCLLRALTAHLILIVENAATNKMTLRNVRFASLPRSALCFFV